MRAKAEEEERVASKEAWEWRVHLREGRVALMSCRGRLKIWLRVSAGGVWWCCDGSDFARKGELYVSYGPLARYIQDSLGDELGRVSYRSHTWLTSLPVFSALISILGRLYRVHHCDEH